MAANDRRNVRANRDKEMAADLRRRGIYHGMHQTKTNAPPIPPLSDMGSAAYRRLTQNRPKK